MVNRSRDLHAMTADQNACFIRVSEKSLFSAKTVANLAAKIHIDVVVVSFQLSVQDF